MVNYNKLIKILYFYKAIKFNIHFIMYLDLLFKILTLKSSICNL
jgi:hypothetical protein